jgi:hypothetical protein
MNVDGRKQNVTLGRVMKHVPAILVMLALFLFVMARNVAPDPYIYDEADYMYAASLGFAANYTDTPTLPIADFVRIGLGRGRDSSQQQALSEQIRASNDAVFYRHWHGPLYLYLLIPVSRLGLSERQVRTAMLAIPALTLAVIYCGCLWLIPGRAGTFAALGSSVLFLSSNSVTGSTELAPHHLFALLSMGFLFCLLKFIASGERTYWYAAVVFVALAFCTLEIAFVLIATLVTCAYMERRRLEAGWRMTSTSLGLFMATVLVVWPAAIYKLSFVKGYLFMVYLALFRKSPWGTEGFFAVWLTRVLDSPLEWTAILASLLLYFQTRGDRGKSRTYPVLVYAALMLAATARVVSSSPRYSLLFMPALDTFAAFTLVPVLMAAPRRVMYGALAMFCGLLGIDEYRLFNRNRNQDPRPPAVLKYIRDNRLEEKTLLVPQADLPMIHYYFPRTHLVGNNDKSPSYPVRVESPR